MTKHARAVAGIVIAFVGASINSCSDSLAPTADIVVSVEKGANWPDTLSVAEIATLTALVRDGSGSPILGVELDWSTSDSTIVTIARTVTPVDATNADRLNDGLRSVATSHAAGTATIIARLNRPGFAAVELRVPVVVAQRSWPVLLTVSRIDTAGIVLSAADAAVLEGATVTWQTNDVSVLRVTRLDSDPFRVLLTPRASGAVTITATVAGTRLGRSVLQLPINVAPLQVAEDATARWDTLMTVSDSNTLKLRVMDARGETLSGVPVQWRSTNTLAIAVGATGQIRALSAGGSEIIATAGPPGFESSEYRAVISVRNLEVGEATNWPDTLTVTDTIRLTASVKDAMGRPRTGVPVRWSSTNTVAFTVDSTGRVTALNQGGGQVIATIGDPPFQTSEHRATIAVLPLKVLETTNWPDSITVTDTVRLAVRVADAANNPRTGLRVRWSSTNTFAFIVDSTGRVIALNEGGGELVASVGEAPFQTSEHRAAITVVARRIVPKVDWPDTLTVMDTVAVAANIKDAAGNTLPNVNVRWSSTNPSAFIVDATGRVIALGQGAGQLVAAVGDPPFQTSERRATITVLPLRVEEAVEWRPDFDIGFFIVLEATVRDAFGVARSGRRVQWRSSNETVLTVEDFPSIVNSARVRPLVYGSADVTATVGGTPFQSSEHRRTLSVTTTWSSIDAGYEHTCAVGSDRTGYCWGSNAYGELGIGGQSPAIGIPTKIATFFKFDDLVAGGDSLSPRPPEAHTCGRSANSVLCWGSFNSSQLGDGSLPCQPVLFYSCSRLAPTVIMNNATTNVVSGNVLTAVGGRISCELLISPSFFVSCWGLATPGVPPDTGFGTVPTNSVTRFGGRAVIVGGEHVCVASDVPGMTRAIKCYGSNTFGQSGGAPGVLGQPSDPAGIVRDAAGTPIQFPFAEYAAGTRHSCVINDRIITQPKVDCWGANTSGQLGPLGPAAIGPDCPGPCSRTAVRVPLPLAPFENVYLVAAGGEHTCVQTTLSRTYCWGSNEFGQLGNNTVGGTSSTPVLVSGGLAFLTLSAGKWHTCGIVAGGVAYCWGRNQSGQLGNGTFTNSPIPVKVLPPRN